MCRGIACIILTIFNVALLLVGLAMLIGGALLKWNRDLVLSLLKKYIPADANFPKESVDTALLKIQEMSDPIGNVLFIMGIVVCCIAVLAFVGLCCHLRLAMIIYAILVGAIFVAHVVVLIVYHSNKQFLLKYVEQGFSTLVLNFVSVSSNQPDSVTLGIMMPALQCCGYNGGVDFKQTGAKFTGQETVSGETYTDMEYPFPCCMPDKVGHAATDCPKVFNDDTSYVNTGCKEPITKLVDQIMNASIIAVVIEGIILILVIVYLCTSK